MMGADCGQHHRGAISTGMLISWAFAWRQHIITVVLCGKDNSPSPVMPFTSWLQGCP